jgi:hypothetical protein
MIKSYHLVRRVNCVSCHNFSNRHMMLVMSMDDGIHKPAGMNMTVDTTSQADKPVNYPTTAK